MATKLDIFISSKMLELKEEREALYDLLPTLDYGDIKLRAWVFEENAPASEESIRDVYLKALENAALYIGLFWNQYGEWTIDEFDKATEWGMERHIYVKDVDADQRDSKLTDFLNQHGDVPTGITAKWFKTTNQLREAVTKSIEVWATNRLRYRTGATYTVSGIFARQPADIPEQPEQLIGRETLQNDVQELLDGGKRVLLLQGFGGMGKTALAATLAAAWVKQNGPVLWIKAGQATSDALFEGLARPFNAQQAMASAQDEAKIAVLQQLLASSGATLLVIDDAWEGDALAPVLQAVPPTLPTLMTSRIRHAVGVIIPVGELDPPAALQLLERHAGASYADDEAPAQLCKTLGYHAYAVEIAGKTLNVDQLTPAELLDKIEATPHDLNVPNDLSAPDRRSIANLIEVSLNALKEQDENAYYAFLATGAFFAPTITPELLALYVHGRQPGPIGRILGRNISVSNRQIKSVDDSLYYLQRRGLVERLFPNSNTVAHYRSHDLAYSYARSKISEYQKSRAVAACLAYTQNYNDPTLENFAALHPEIENFLGAATWAFDAEKYIIVEDFAWNLVPAGGSRFLDLQGYFREARSLLDLAAKAAAKRGDRRSEGSHLNHLGNTYGNLGLYVEAIDFHTVALHIARDISDRRLEGAALGNLGNLYLIQGQFLAAIDYYQKVLVISRQINDRRSESTALGNLGSAYASISQHDQAIKHRENSLNIARKIGDQRSERAALSGLGNDFCSLGQYNQAIDYYQLALTIAIEMGHRRGEGQDLGNLGNIYTDLGHYQTALDHHLQARAIFVELDIPDLIEWAEQNIAETQAAQAADGSNDTSE